MRLFPEPLDIGEFEGFTKEKDIFKRKEFGEGLQRLFERVDEPLTVILDSPWGTGKSTFIEMWCGHMRQQGFPVIHFDAFKHDHVDDAFGALAGEVFAKAEEYYSAVKDQEKGELVLSDAQRDSLKDKAKILFNVTRRFGKVVLKTGAKGVAKRLAEKAVGEEATEELKEHFGEFSAELIKASADSAGEELGVVLEELIDSKFAGRSQQVLLIEDFTTKLSELALELRKPAAELAAANGFDISDVETGNRPLIFVIDELDRCKPTFSLEILELIKHFFAQENIHFLLSTHTQQLENSVKHAYGIVGQECEYLQKFYSMIVKLPLKNKESVTLEYCMRLLEEAVEGFSKHIQGEFLNTASVLFEKNIHKFSLRAIEKIMAQIRMLLATVDMKCIEMFSAVILTIPFLQVDKPEVYNQILSKEFVPFDIREYWDLNSTMNPDTREYYIREEWGAFTNQGRSTYSASDKLLVRNEVLNSLSFNHPDYYFYDIPNIVTS